MSSLRIIGAGGHGKVIADIAVACGYTDIAFVDQSWPQRRKNGDWPIIATTPPLPYPVFCAIGDNSVRTRISLDHPDMPTLLHPAAVLSPSARLGSGTAVMAGVIVNADAQIGRGVILNTGCSIDHDCILGDFVHISPGARLAGNVQVGQGTWIGIGSVVREGVKIGKHVIVAAGAAVLDDIPDNTRVGGVPARPI